jgi:hypothetical protein
MKNMRKLLAIVLCLLLVPTSFATVSAEEGEFSGIVSKNIEVTETGDVEVLIDIAGNPGIMALILDVYYDSEVLTLKENGFTDTGLLVGNVETTITKNPFRLGWQHSDATSVNNYKNGNIAKLAFEMKDGFIGTTNVEVKVVEAQTFGEDYVFRLVPMESGVISVTRPKLAIKDGVAIANSVDGETLIIASYDENSMVDCKVYPNAAGDVQIKVADVLDLSGATKVKAFLWKDLETCMPLGNHAEEELNITDIN